MSQPNRTGAGGRIDRARELRFRFDDRQYVGHPGDTLASALLANDVHFVARSFKYHRPRGILAAGGEEPNALVTLRGEVSEPNARATQVELHEGLEADSQNCWPSLGWDVGALAERASALLAAGFYYKTFMWPASMWRHYERLLRRAAGLGRAPEHADPAAYEHVHAHCDVLVVGAGPAGLTAALAAGRAGARVILADGQPEAGGRLLSERAELDGRPALAWVGAATQSLRALAEVRVLQRTTIAGYYDHNYLIGCETVRDGTAANAVLRQRLWKIRAREVVLATGALERALIFPDNDRPGIMLASAVRTYLNRHGVRAGERVVVVTGNDDAYRTALDLAGAGTSVVAIIDLRAEARGFLPQQARARGIEVLTGYAIAGSDGRTRVRRLTAYAPDGIHRNFECDLVAMSGGWVPNVQLHAQARGRLVYDNELDAFVPGESMQAATSAGAARGGLSLRDALIQGWDGGSRAAEACGFARLAFLDMPQPAEPAESDGTAPHAWRLASAAKSYPQRGRTPMWTSPSGPRASGARKAFVDYHTDVTVADIALAVQEGYEVPEHVKRYTTAGMGVDQGKTGSMNTLAVLAELRAMPVGAFAATTSRPPAEPLGFGGIAGANTGVLFDPIRTTPMHAWHQRHGAVFEDVGQWRRARYYPHAGESMRAALERECLAVRRGLGIFDASTLGKIDVQGRDATELIDRIYCNDMRSLAIGRCRYGLMLRQDGMVFDDGVVARLAEHHYLMTTTTGGAAGVAHWIEDWLQTEWPELEVYCTPVGEQYAQIALAGPHCVEALAPLTDVRLAAMPYMSLREGTVAGIPARILRVSFSGALGYEIAVPAGRGRELWATLIGAGERFGITPYGTEAMHVLRAEMGYIIIGQETDGSVTPIDLGFDRMLAHDKWFIGKRSLARPDLQRRDRKQLVGLVTEPQDTVLAEGAQLVAEPVDASRRLHAPVAMLGHVTSSYYSAACGRAIALALVKAGVSRLGESLYAVADGPPLKVTLTAPRFIMAAPADA